MPPLRVMEVFAGGGTLTAALTGNPAFQVTAGVEIEPDFADEWQAQHAAATLVQSDIRALHTSELPEFDVLIGGMIWIRTSKPMPAELPSAHSPSED